MTAARVLIIAEYPFRDLLPRAQMGWLLAEHRRAHPGGPPLLVATRATTTPPGFQPVALDADVRALGVAQVVLAGVFLERKRLEAALALAAGAMACGARLVLRNFAVEGDAAQRAPPASAAVLDQAESITLRDHRSANVMTLWRVRTALTIEPYPERHIAADPTLAALLPEGPILGLAIRAGADMEASWKPRIPALRRLLARAAGWPVLPLPIQGPGSAGNDLAASTAFAQAVLDGPALLLPQLADAEWWRREVSPARLKGLVAHCALVATNRDLPACYAVAAGVPVLGIALGADRRIVSCLATLANELPEGSDLVHPLPGPVA